MVNIDKNDLKCYHYTYLRERFAGSNPRKRHPDESPGVAALSTGVR